MREFERRFPGIKVNLSADFSNILAPIIDKEIAEKRLSVDLTIFQTLQDYARWKKQGASSCCRYGSTANLSLTPAIRRI